MNPKTLKRQETRADFVNIQLPRCATIKIDEPDEIYFEALNHHRWANPENLAQLLKHYQHDSLDDSDDEEDEKQKEQERLSKNNYERQRINALYLLNNNIEDYDNLQEYIKSKIEEKEKISDLKREQMRKVVNYLFCIPPDFDKAKQHGEAQQLRCATNSIDIIENRCICCDRILPEYTKRISLCDSPSKLIEHGDGFPLLFQSLKFMGSLFVVKFIMLGLFALIVYLTKKNSGDISISNLFSIKTIVNDTNGVNNTLITVYEAIELISNVLLIIMICIFWVFQDRYVKLLDEETQTDADFAVMFINLPYTLLNNELRKAIENTGINESDIIYINKCYRFDHILKLKKQQLYWLQKQKYLEVYRGTIFKDY